MIGAPWLRAVSEREALPLRELSLDLWRGFDRLLLEAVGNEGIHDGLELHEVLLVGGQAERRDHLLCLSQARFLAEPERR